MSDEMVRGHIVTCWYHSVIVDTITRGHQHQKSSNSTHICLKYHCLVSAHMCLVCEHVTVYVCIEYGFTKRMFKRFLFCWRASDIALVLPQEPPDQEGSVVKQTMPIYCSTVLFTQQKKRQFVNLTFSYSMRQWICDRDFLYEEWLTDRRGRATAAWRWLAPGHAVLRKAWCPPTCPALCLSPLASHSFWMTTVHHPHPAHFSWIAP